jgi:hypothetical protein
LYVGVSSINRVDMSSNVFDVSQYVDDTSSSSIVIDVGGGLTSMDFLDVPIPSVPLSLMSPLKDEAISIATTIYDWQTPPIVIQPIRRAVSIPMVPLQNSTTPTTSSAQPASASASVNNIVTPLAEAPLISSTSITAAPLQLQSKSSTVIPATAANSSARSESQLSVSSGATSVVPSSLSSSSTSSSLSSSSSSSSKSTVVSLYPELEGKFEVFERIGRGTFSQVYRAIEIGGQGRVVAVKRIVAESLPGKAQSELEFLHKQGSVYASPISLSSFGA